MLRSLFGGSLLAAAAGFTALLALMFWIALLVTALDFWNLI